MSIITVCRQAWGTTKKDHQPAFDDLIQSYQNMLQARATGAITSGVPNDDGPLASFDQAAIKANVEIEPPALEAELPSEVKAELVQEVVEELPAPTPKRKHVRTKPVVKAEIVVKVRKKIAPKKAVKKAVAKSTKEGAKKR